MDTHVRVRHCAWVVPYMYIAILLLHYTCMVLCGERHVMHMYAEY